MTKILDYDGLGLSPLVDTALEHLLDQDGLLLLLIAVEIQVNSSNNAVLPKLLWFLVNQYVYAGSDSYMDENFAFQVEDYRSHDRFNIATAQNNICLLKLKKNVPFTERSYPICLGELLNLN